MHAGSRGAPAPKDAAAHPVAIRRRGISGLPWYPASRFVVYVERQARSDARWHLCALRHGECHPIRKQAMVIWHASSVTWSRTSDSAHIFFGHVAREHASCGASRLCRDAKGRSSSCFGRDFSFRDLICATTERNTPLRRRGMGKRIFTTRSSAMRSKRQACAAKSGSAVSVGDRFSVLCDCCCWGGSDISFDETSCDLLGK